MKANRPSSCLMRMPESGNSAPPTAGKYLRHAPGSETHIGEGELIVKRIFVAAIAVSMLSGCMTTLQHREAVQDDSADRMTVGKVQREIKVGMSGAQVAQVLGSPNIVSTDEQRREVWIYDKIATDTAYSTSTGGISTLVLAWGGSAAGLAAPGFSQAAGASSKSQRTLTVIIKFDEGKAVRDFAYHTSRF